jgi:hypothetical protein
MKASFWEHPAEKESHHRHLSKKQKESAKAMARAAGRPYPNLVDNVRASHRGSKEGGR